MDKENFGPAERIIQTMVTYADHCWHGRPGIVTPNTSLPGGLAWDYGVAHLRCRDHNNAKIVTRCSKHPEMEFVRIPSKKQFVCSICLDNLKINRIRVCSVCNKNIETNGVRVAFRLSKAGKKNVESRVGIVQQDNKIMERGQCAGEFRQPGLFPEIVTWMYKQVAEVWKLDNEFAAKWASYAFDQNHRDIKMIMAAFMLVQNRKGEPVKENNKVAFFDEDYRDVGEAMILTMSPKNQKDNENEIRPKFLLRMRDVLSLPSVVELNKQLGFGNSQRNPFYGRWNKAVEKWLRYREENPKMLEGLVKGGMRQTVIELARKSGYKPISDKFFEILRWKQFQSKGGHRELAIGKDISKAETWTNLSEAQICERITNTKPNYKKVVGMLPNTIGMTRAIMAACIDSGCLSNRDLIIATPTLEELGLLHISEYKTKWEAATRTADDTRANNIATRVKSKSLLEALQAASDTALQKAVSEVVKNMRVYVFVDISGSMQPCIQVAKGYIAKFLQAFPLDRLHVAVFNTIGREVCIKHASSSGVENAFRGVNAGGGTHYASGVLALDKYKPKNDEDSLFIFIGDEQQMSTFETAVTSSGLRPMAFGFIHVTGSDGSQCRAVQDTARILGIPCFMINEATFADPYAIPRTIRALVSATPVNRSVTTRIERESLVDIIMKTELLKKPTWAA